MQEIPTMERPTPAPPPPMYAPQMYPPPTYQPPQWPVLPPKKKMSTRKKWFLGILIFLVIVIVGLIGGAVGRIGGIVATPPVLTQPPATVVPTPQPTQKPTPSAEDRYKSASMDTTVEQLVTAGNDNKNVVVHFSATAYIVMDTGTSKGAMLNDPGNSNRYVMVLFPDGVDMSKIAENDTLELWGQDLGVFTSGTLTAPGISVVYLVDHTSGYAIH